LKIAKRELPKLERLARAGATGEFYDRAFNFIRQYLGARLGLSPQSLTENSIDAKLAQKVADPALLGKIKKAFSDCYLARFAAVGMNKDDAAATFAALKEIVTKFTKLNFVTISLNT